MKKELFDSLLGEAGKEVPHDIREQLAESLRVMKDSLDLDFYKIEEFIKVKEVEPIPAEPTPVEA